MPIDVEKVENSFEWETFKDGKPYLGTYRQEMKGRVKMHTQKLDLENWVKIDKTYASQQREKERLLETLDHNLVFATNDDACTEAAKNELLSMLIDYLPKRFPDKFERREGGIYNKMLEEFVSDSTSKDVDDPLLRAARLTQEDWCMMEWKDEHEAYVLTAASLFFPMRWSLQDKWNQPMLGIHKPVDGFMNHLAKRVADLFKAMSPDAPVLRGNWAFFNDLDGPLDLYTPSGHEARNAEHQISKYEGEATGRQLTFRAEYQTLRKLPESRAIVFSIRTYQFYLEEFKNFPREDVEDLINAIENIHPEFVAYKSASFWKEASLEYLKKNVLSGMPASTRTKPASKNVRRAPHAAAAAAARPANGNSWSFSFGVNDSMKVIAVLSVGAAAVFIANKLRS